MPSLDLVITRQTGQSGPWEYSEYLRRACAAVLPSDIINTVTAPWGTLVILVLIAGVLGIVAALLPARRAARLDVLEAISFE